MARDFFNKWQVSIMNENAHATIKVSKHIGMEIWKYVCKESNVYFKNMFSVKLKFNNSIKINKFITIFKLCLILQYVIEKPFRCKCYKLYQ
jgi:hypothetical protein